MPINYKDYPSNWRHLVAQVLFRAKNRCEFCGLKNYQTVYSILYKDNSDKNCIGHRIWFRNYRDALRECSGRKIKKVKVILTVAHLDQDPLNCQFNIDRLKALCQMCHLRYDTFNKLRNIFNKQNL